MELKDFIKMKETAPWVYNFEFECGDEGYRKLKPFMRYFIYKSQPAVAPAIYLKNTVEFLKNNFGYRPVYDPDGSNQRLYYPIVIEIYKHLWSWKCPVDPEQRKDSPDSFAEVEGNIFGSCRFGSDTMNSVQTALNKAKAVNVRSFYQTINKYYDPEKNDVNIDEKEKIWSEIVQYIDWYHTLGNFVLVPAGFNGYRGTRGKINGSKINDFWDLSLKYLKENGYRDCKYGGVFDKCMFNEYINYFFLWDSVKHDKDNGCYNVKDISHKDDGLGKPQFSSEFFEKTREIIERRGRFMTAMLMLEQDNPVLYKKIQGWLVLKNDNGKLPLFYGMNNAAEEILKKFGEEIPENAKGILKGLSSWKLHE